MRIRLPILFVLLIMILSACGDFEWLPGTNPNVDTTPDQFSFTNSVKCNATLNTDLISNEITVSGINSPTIISIKDGEYSVDGSTTWLTGQGVITNGQRVKVRPPGGQLKSSNTLVNVDLTIGSVFAIYTVDSGACITGTN